MSDPTTSAPAPARGLGVHRGVPAAAVILGLAHAAGGVDKFEAGGLYSHANYLKNMDRMATASRGVVSAVMDDEAVCGLLGYVLLALGWRCCWG